LTEPHLNTPDALAVFLAGIGYPRTEIVDAVRKDFPDADADAVTDAAIGSARQQNAELDRAVERDEAAARAAEHDVSKTMHQEGE
jgi:hypothetical protein